MLHPEEKKGKRDWATFTYSSVFQRRYISGIRRSSRGHLPEASPRTGFYGGREAGKRRKRRKRQGKEADQETGRIRKKNGKKMKMGRKRDIQEMEYMPKNKLITGIFCIK